MKNPDAISEKGNPVCGDVMKMYLKIGRKKSGEEFVEDIKFETLGCVAAIAVSSALTEIVKGKTLDEALKVNKDNIVEGLGGLPALKIHCSMLGVDALHQAIKNYQSSPHCHSHLRPHSVIPTSEFAGISAEK